MQQRHQKRYDQFKTSFDPQYDHAESFGEDSLEQWEVSSSDSYAYDDRLMQQSYVMDDYLPNEQDEVYYLIKSKGKKRGKQMIILDDPRDDTSDPGAPYQKLNMHALVSPSRRKMIKATTGTKNRKARALPPQPIGPVMIRRTTRARPVIVSEPIRKQNVHIPSGTTSRKPKKKVIRYRKLRRMDIRKSRLEEEYKRAAAQLENLRMTLQMYNTLENQDHQKLADNIIYRNIVPEQRVIKRRSYQKAVDYDAEEYGEEDFDEIEMDDAYGPMYIKNSHRLAPPPRGALRAQGSSSLSIFSPHRVQKKAFVPPQVDTDSESSQVFMYDDEEEEHLAKFSQDNDDDVSSISHSGNETRPRLVLKSNSDKGLQSKREMKSAEENLPVEDSHDDLDDDDEEDEDGAPFTQRLSESFDHDKIGQETIFQEINVLIQLFKENLGFLFVILREMRKVDSYESRLACLKFFETLTLPNEEHESHHRGNSSKGDKSKEKNRRNNESEAGEHSDSDQSESSYHHKSSSTEAPHPPTLSDINKIAQPMPDEETSDDEDDDDDVEDGDGEEEDSTSNNTDNSNNDDEEDTEYDDGDDSGAEVSASGSDIDSQTAKNKDLLETLNLKLISLVYDRQSSKQTYTPKSLTQLSRDILLTVSRHVPTATVELLESLHETVMNYSNQNIVSCRDDLIQDVLDMLYDETIFNRLVSNIDSSYKEDIAAVKSRLNSLKKQRRNDIEKLKNDRLARLRAGNPYPHSLMQPGSSIPPQPVSPNQRFRQFSPKHSTSDIHLNNMFDIQSTSQTSHQESADRPSSPYQSNVDSVDSNDNNDVREEFQKSLNNQSSSNKTFPSTSPSKKEIIVNGVSKVPLHREHHTLSSIQSEKESKNVPSRSNQFIVKSPKKLNISESTILPQTSESSIISMEGMDEFSELSNQAVFDMSSEFDIEDVEDPIELANQVLQREVMRRSLTKDSSHHPDYITIDDLPKPNSTQEEDSIMNSRELQSLEQPLLVSAEEDIEEAIEEEAKDNLPKPNAQLYQDADNSVQHAVFTPTEWDKPYVPQSLIQQDLQAYSEELSNTAEIFSDEIPHPEQHNSFSMNSQQLNSRFVEEFGKSLQKLTSKYGKNIKYE